MNSNKFLSFSVILTSILYNNIVTANEVESKETRKDEGVTKYAVKDFRGEKFNYTFRLSKVTQIMENVSYPANIGQREKTIKICTICNLDHLSLDRLCRIAIITLKLGEKYDILYADGAPVEQTRMYRVQRRHSKIPRERVIFARKCPTAPALYLTSGRSPRSVTVIMKKPRNRLRRFIQKQRRPTDIGI